MNAKNRQQRQARVRAKVRGKKTRPRVSVHRSNRSLLVQIINDEQSSTLASVRGTKAKEVAAELASKLKEQKIKRLVFDRGGYAYHGSVKELAESLRAEGLEF